MILLVLTTKADCICAIYMVVV